jgi:hypothetical protein
MPNGIYTPGQSNAYVDRLTNQRMPYSVQRPGYPGSQAGYPIRRGMFNLFGYPETRSDRLIRGEAPRSLLKWEKFRPLQKEGELKQPGPKRRKEIRNRPGHKYMSLRQLNQRRANRARRGLRPLV